MKIIDSEMYASARSGNRSAGRAEYIKYLEGKRLTRQQAIRAKCFDCSGMGCMTYCEISSCSLAPYTPYKR